MSTWQSRPLFVSSTFRDMQLERDYLRDVVFHAFQEFLIQHRIQLEVVDLRWGVDSSDEQEREQKELHILKVCLDEVDRCRPFMLVLVGDRYGWVPPPELLSTVLEEKGLDNSDLEKSITALELEYGLLSDFTLEKRCFFYFRNLIGLDQLDETVRSQWDDRYHPDAVVQARASKLNEIRTRICNAYPDRWRTYTLNLLNEDERRANLRTFGEIVLEDLKKDIFAFASDLDLENRSWLDVESAAFDQFVQKNIRDFTGRKDMLEWLISHALSSTLQQGHIVVLMGEAGSGKSALLAKLYEVLLSTDCLVLGHAAGISDTSGQLETLMRKWVWQLARFSTPTIPDPTAQIILIEEIQQMFLYQLERVSKLTRVILLVDALNQFDRTARMQQMTWLPQVWIENVVLIATGIEGPETAVLARRKGGVIKNIPRLTSLDASSMLVRLCRRHHKALSPMVSNSILGRTDRYGRQACNNPLWVQIVTEQLLLLDEYDFAEALSLPGTPEEQLTNLMCRRVENYPAEATNFYDHIFRKTHQDMGNRYNIRFTQSLLEIIALSQNGWRERDLQHLLDCDGLVDFGWQFSVVRRFLRAHLLQTGLWGQWRFAHQQPWVQIRQAVLADMKRYREIHFNISGYLAALPSSDPLRQRELTFHLLEARDQAGLVWNLATRSNEEAIFVRNAVLRFLIQTENNEPTWPWLIEALLSTGPKLTGPQIRRLGDFLANELYHLLSDQYESDTAIKVLQGFLKLLSQLPEEIILKNDLLQIWIKSEQNLAGLMGQKGLFDQAEQHYKNAVTQIAKRYNDTNIPPSIAYALTGILEQWGDQEKRRGNLAQASEWYEYAIRTLVKLREFFPDEVLFQWGQGRIRERQGDLFWAKRQSEEAIRLYLETLNVYEQVRKTFPEDAQVQIGLATIHRKIGYFYLQTQVYSPASIEHLRQAEDLQIRLYNQYPDQQSSITGLLETGLLLSDALLNAGYYEEAVRVQEQIQQIMPADSWNAGLHMFGANEIFLYIRMGGLATRRGNNQDAWRMFKHAIEIGEQLFGRYPETAINRSAYGQALMMAGILHQMVNLYQPALSYCLQAYDLFDKEIVSEVQDHVLSLVEVSIGEIYLRMGNTEKSLEYLTKARGRLESMIQYGVSKTQYLLAPVLQGFGKWYLEQKQEQEALNFFNEALAIWSRQASEQPEADLIHELADAHYRVGLTLKKQGKLEEANTHFRQSFALFEEMKRKNMLNTADEVIYDEIIAVLNPAPSQIIVSDFSKEEIWLLKQLLLMPRQALTLKELVTLLQTPDKSLIPILNGLMERRCIELYSDGVYRLIPSLYEIFNDLLPVHRNDAQLLFASILEITKPNLRLNPLRYAGPFLFYATFLEQQLSKEATRDLATLQHRIAWIYLQEGSLKIALEYQEKAVNTIEQLGGGGFPNASWYNQLGKIHYKMKNIEQTHFNYEKALTLLGGTAKTDPLELAAAHEGMGLVLNTNGHRTMAIDNLEKSLDLRQSALQQDDPLLADSYLCFASVHYKTGEFERCAYWLEKARNLLELVLEDGHPKFVSLYTDLGLLAWKQERYMESHTYIKRALRIEMAFRWPHPDIGRAYTVEGLTYLDEDRAEQARMSFQKAIYVYDQIFPSDHLTIALAYYDLARALFKLKYYDEALRRLDKAIGIQLSQHSVKGLELHFSYRLQAWIKRELGKIEEGIDCAQKAMDQLKGETSEYRIEFAQVYNLFGVLYQEQKSYSLAIDYYKKSLALYEDQPLTAHLARAQICLNLGLALLADGNIGDATENFHKSTTLREEFLSPLHPDLAQSYHCLADTYWRKIDYDQASFYQAKSLAIYQAILPEDDLTLSESYNRMGALHLNKEDYSKALGYYQKSIAIKERLHGVKHRDLGPLLWRLGSIFLKLGHNNRAETAFNRSKEILEANLAQGVPELARLYLSMAINYSALIRFDDARLYIHKCLDIHKMNEQEDMETAEAYFHCGQVYSSLRYFQESVGPLKRCISIIIRLRGDRHISLKRSYQTLMYIYDQLGRSEEQKAIQLLLDGIGENQ